MSPCAELLGRRRAFAALRVSGDSLTGLTHRRRSFSAGAERLHGHPDSGRPGPDCAGSANPAGSGGERRPVARRGQHGPVHHPLPQGTDRESERGGDPRDPASGRPAPRARRAQGDDPQGDRGPGQAHRRARRGDPRGRQPQAARRPVPAVQAEEEDQGVGGARQGPGAAGVPGLDARRDPDRPGRGGPGVRQPREGARHRSRRCSKGSATSWPRRSASWPPSATPSAGSSGRRARSSPRRPRSPRARGSSIATTSTTPSRSPTSRRTASWRSTVATRKARSRSSSRCRGPSSRARSSASCRSRATPRPTSSAPSALDALDRLLLPSMEREVRRDLTELAERHAVDVFARNLRSLLLQPPIPKQVVLAIDPGFRTGCKVAVLDGHGNLLDQGVIHPHPPQNRRSEAKHYLKDLVGKHQVGVVAIGNGTACRETEELIAEIIAEGTQFSQNPRGAVAARARRRRPDRASRPAMSPTPPSPIVAGRADAIAEPTPGPRRVASAATSEPPRARGRRPGRLAAARRPETLRRAARDAEPSPTADPAETPSRRCRRSPEVRPSRRDRSRDRGSAEPRPHARRRFAPPSCGREPSEADRAARRRRRAASGAAAVVDATPNRASTNPPPRRLRPTAEASSPAAPAIEPRPSRRRADRPQPPQAASEARPTRPRRAARPRQRRPSRRARPSRGGRGKSDRRDHGRPGRRSPGPPPPPPPSRTRPTLARPARLCDRQRGRRQRLLGQPGRPRGVPRLRRHPAQHDLDRPQAPGPARRAGQDRAAEHRRRALPARRQPQAAQGVARGGHRELRQLRRRRPEHGERPAAAARLGPEPADRPADRRTPQGERPVHRTASSCIEVEGVGPATFTQAAGFLKIRDGEQPARPDLGPPRELPGRRPGCWRSWDSPPRSSATRSSSPSCTPSSTRLDSRPWRASSRSASRPCATSVDALARPDRDPRDDLPKPIFKKGVLKLEDLQPPAWS